MMLFRSLEEALIWLQNPSFVLNDQGRMEIVRGQDHGDCCVMVKYDWMEGTIRYTWHRATRSIESIEPIGLFHDSPHKDEYDAT